MMRIFKKDIDERRKRFEAEALPLLNDMHALAYYYTGSQERAEDLVQDTYLKAYREFDKYKPGTNIKAWLARILTNIYYNNYRRFKLESETFVHSHDFSEFEERTNTEQEDGERFPKDMQAFYDELSDEVVNAMLALPEEFRTVVILSDIMDYSYMEVAEIIGHPIGTVMSRLYRARKQLREKLEEFAVREGYVKHTDENGVIELRKRKNKKKMNGGSDDEL